MTEYDSDLRDARTRPRMVASLPLRSLDDGKRRLRNRLTRSERQELVLTLLDVAVAALRESGVVNEVALVSGDDRALGLAAHMKLVPIREATAGLNSALLTAREWAKQARADAHLIILPDLPLLRASDIRAVVEAAFAGAGVVLCPDRTDTGTNLLLTHPRDAIRPLFGSGSFERHQQAAVEAGLPARIVRTPGTSWDIDTAEDFDEWILIEKRAEHQV
ncbi:MAG: hypothetical protein AVDCRST_MAG26-4447 [uncultured Chloroflexia bacterium]|uniref:Phosphoenolpyruvate guanylyltransferase n=1 Tax=uncultured Chloroflexia bacterium TaxID=1672391 RepID=A0A6J4K5D7_9CHLR|nr:MAG: hypothetical protein AVDCRST_MAG26-4447 [uncultured Chloroflexia bacterium]